MATETTPTQTTAPRTLTLTVPLPWPLLTPNTRLHWAERSRYTKQQRRAAGLGVVTQAPANWLFDPPIDEPYFAGRVRMDVTVYPRPRMKEPDDDNFWAALKATIDGLQDAGLVANDKQFRMGTLTWDKGQRTGELVITLTEVGGE